MKRKVLKIDMKENKYSIEETDSFGPVDYSIEHYQKELFCFGSGPFVASAIPGMHRLIFASYSSLWDGFFISTLGGGAMQLLNAGVDYVEIKNRAKEFTLVKIKDKSCSFVKIPEDKLNEVFNGYKEKKGFYALQEYAYDLCLEDYRKDGSKFRILAVGPAALKTAYGAIGSSPMDGYNLRKNEDSWAGRGGIGSELAQKHGIVAIAYGGKNAPEGKISELQQVNDFFKKEFGKDMMIVVNEATAKYKYDEATKTGGTFGSNMSSLKDWLLSFNWTSIYMDEAERTRIYENFVKNHYLKQFNEETIVPKKFTTCGEACPVVCKKWNNIYKKDYEPYEANGPNCGIFDQRAAELITKKIDEMGFDAIEAGNIISWIMELLSKDMLPAKYGLNKKPKFRPENFDVITDSIYNAYIAMEIADMLVSEKGIDFSEGIRSAANKLGEKAKNLALYTPNCKKGSIAPCQYWLPAFFLPMTIQGKFHSDYEMAFKTPYDIGKSSAERMVKEIGTDNSGTCRFHRKWSEKAYQKIAEQFLGEKIDYQQHHKELVKKIMETNRCTAVEIWESTKVFDVIETYIEKLYRTEPGNAALKQWVDKFRVDKQAAAKEYWNDVIKGFNDYVLK